MLPRLNVICNAVELANDLVNFRNNCHQHNEFNDTDEISFALPLFYFVKPLDSLGGLLNLTRSTTPNSTIVRNSCTIKSGLMGVDVKMSFVEIIKRFILGVCCREV